jgi:pyruvate-ferredoxin/flavodoxin oxidoreductase
LQQQTRFKMLLKSHPEHAKLLWQEAQQDAEARYRMYEYMAQRRPQQAAALAEVVQIPVITGK